MIKYFRGKKYYLRKDKRWFSAKEPRTYLFHDVWNYNYPNDSIKEGEIIHHVNGDPSNNRIENLQKLTNEEHSRLHNSNENNLNWKGGISKNGEYDKNYLKRKELFSMCNMIDNFQYQDTLIFNLRTEHITVTHSWRGI